MKRGPSAYKVGHLVGIHRKVNSGRVRKPAGRPYELERRVNFLNAYQAKGQILLCGKEGRNPDFSYLGIRHAQSTHIFSRNYFKLDLILHLSRANGYRTEEAHQQNGESHVFTCFT